MIIQYLSVAIRVRSMVKKKGYLSRGWVIFINILQPLLALTFLVLSLTSIYVDYDFLTLSDKELNNDSIVDGRDSLARTRNRLQITNLALESALLLLFGACVFMIFRYFKTHPNLRADEKSSGVKIFIAICCLTIKGFLLWQIIEFSHVKFE